MKCHEVRKLFPLYYDSEGDAELQLRIGDHLAACETCRGWFSRESRQFHEMEERIRGDVEPTADVWSRIEERCERPAVAKVAALRSWPALTAVAVAILLLAIGLVGLSNRSKERLSAQAVSVHDAYVRGAQRPLLSSESVEEIERWLHSSAGFSVRCPPQGQADFRLRGANVRRFGDRTAAHIVGSVRDRPVSIFVLPGDSLAEYPHLRRHLVSEGDRHACREGRYQMVVCIRHGHIVLAMGEDSPQVLNQVLQGYGSYHEDHHRAHVSQLQPPRDFTRFTG